MKGAWHGVGMHGGKWEKVCQGSSTMEGTRQVILGFFY